MRLTLLELRNVKSYVDSGPIFFSPGVNTICGPNGAGKSTILEAIGFALFDSLLYTQGQFRREGAARGEVVVGFLSALDGREYQVVRPVGSGTVYVYDPEVFDVLVTGKKETQVWLREHLQVAPTADLQALFVDAVGVPQGLLTAPFLDRVPDRQRRFDPLLQVADYELAWARLRETASYLQEALASLAERRGELHGTARYVPQMEQEAAKLREDVGIEEDWLSAVVEQLAGVSAHEARLDMAGEQVAQLTHRIEKLAQRQTGLDQRLADARAELGRARAAAQVCQESEPGYRQYEAAQARLDELEDQRPRHDRLAARLARVERAAALAAGDVARLEAMLAELAQAERRLAELAPRLVEQEQLERQLRALEQQAPRLELARQRADEERVRLARLVVELVQVGEGLATRPGLVAAVAAGEHQQRELARQAAALAAEQQQIAEQGRQIGAWQALLEQAGASVCPVCRRPLDAHQARELAARYQAELAQLEVRRAELEQQYPDCDRARQAVAAQLAGLQEQLDAGPHPDRESDLRHEIAMQEQVVTRWQDECAALAGVPEQMIALSARLAALGRPRDEGQRLQVEVDKQPQLAADLAAARTRRAQQSEQRAAVAAQLQDLVNLDDAVAAQRAALAASQADHTRYLEYRQAAESVPQRQAQVNQLTAQRDRAAAQQTRATAKLQAAQAGYDQAQHERLAAERQQLTVEQARLEERLDAGRAQLTELEDELAVLQKVQADLVALEEEQASLNRLVEALRFLRETIRAAGPIVTRALVQAISAEASRILVDILNDPALMLQWGADYGITVTQQGHPRDFAQLSGGEKVAAALAVRLALLREMSDIRLAFFDEPTAHLDDERRENLAMQLTRIEGLEQIFVITHDDALARETHHLLRVYQEGGVSQVEVG
ncbi:MAG: SMC family ATPase [Chloroflexi bacterium]|nr:SMC family ATPase [Chloroflexota bacterium]MBU1750421.1 SMC family ATPase [Chloroflexota bacterium]